MRRDAYLLASADETGAVRFNAAKTFPSRIFLHEFLAHRNQQDLASGSGGPIGAEAAVLLLDRQGGLDPDLAHGWVMFGIEELHSGRMVGEVGIFLPAGAECGDLVWTIHPDHQRQCLATGAARVLLAWAFERRGLHG